MLTFIVTFKLKRSAVVNQVSAYILPSGIMIQLASPMQYWWRVAKFWKANQWVLLFVRLFFDVSDGIFLNYCWKEDHLVQSKSVAVDCKRPYDVYVGIDVFGRGCLGDGGFNTKEVIQKNCSIVGNWKIKEREYLLTNNRFWLVFKCREAGIP